jgi:hypothetical protein
MPKYYFHVRNGNETFNDTEGSVHPSLEKAWTEALQIARELARDEEVYAGYVVSVVDREGYEVATVLVDTSPAVSESGSQRR